MHQEMLNKVSKKKPTRIILTKILSKSWIHTGEGIILSKVPPKILSTSLIFFPLLFYQDIMNAFNDTNTIRWHYWVSPLPSI